MLPFLIWLAETNWEDLISNVKSYQTWKNVVSYLDVESCNSAQRIVWLMWGYTWRNIFFYFGQNFLTCTDQGISSFCTTSHFSFKKNIIRVFSARLHESVAAWISLYIWWTFPLFLLDNTAGIVTKRSGFRRRLQEIYFLPVVIEDNGYPTRSSTSTLTIRVCGCESDGSLLTCSAEAIFLPVGLSTGALIAILLCIIILLGEILCLLSKLQTTIIMAVLLM